MLVACKADLHDVQPLLGRCRSRILFQIEGRVAPADQPAQICEGDQCNSGILEPETHFSATGRTWRARGGCTVLRPPLVRGSARSWRGRSVHGNAYRFGWDLNRANATRADRLPPGHPNASIYTTRLQLRSAPAHVTVYQCLSHGVSSDAFTDTRINLCGGTTSDGYLSGKQSKPVPRMRQARGRGGAQPDRRTRRTVMRQRDDRWCHSGFRALPQGYRR